VTSKVLQAAVSARSEVQPREEVVHELAQEKKFLGSSSKKFQKQVKTG
jgi:hypothetical protein